MENPFTIEHGGTSPHRGYNHCNAVLAFGETNMLAGWTTKAFAVHWASHFNLLKQPDQRYPQVLSEFIFCCWPDIGTLFATTIHSPNPDEEEPDQPDEEEPDQQITYPKYTDGFMLEDCLQLVQPDVLHPRPPIGLQGPVGLPVGLPELAPSPDVGLQEPAQEPEVVMPPPPFKRCVDWDAPPTLVDLGSNDQSSGSSNMVLVRRFVKKELCL